ncbi:MAG: hypothetical protein AAGF12_27765 [Myxococcota bacterium]
MANNKKRRPPKPAKPKRDKKYRPPKDDEYESGSGGGVMQGMVSGVQKAAGVHDSQKKRGGSFWASLFWYVLFAGAAGYLIYTYVR